MRPRTPSSTPESLDSGGRRARFLAGVALGVVVPAIGLVCWAGIAGTFIDRAGGDVAIGVVVYGFFTLVAGVPLVMAIVLASRHRSRHLGLGMLASLAVLAIVVPSFCRFTPG